MDATNTEFPLLLLKTTVRAQTSKALAPLYLMNRTCFRLVKLWCTSFSLKTLPKSLIAEFKLFKSNFEKSSITNSGNFLAL